MSVASIAQPQVVTRDFTRQPLGKIGMWWFLASEIMVFGGLMGSYILSRIAAGGWVAERAHVNTRLAVLNTLVLLTSSLTIVEAHAATATRRPTRMCCTPTTSVPSCSPCCRS